MNFVKIVLQCSLFNVLLLNRFPQAFLKVLLDPRISFDVLQLTPNEPDHFSLIPVVDGKAKGSRQEVSGAALSGVLPLKHSCEILADCYELSKLTFNPQLAHLDTWIQHF